MKGALKLELSEMKVSGNKPINILAIVLVCGIVLLSAGCSNRNAQKDTVSVGNNGLVYTPAEKMLPDDASRTLSEWKQYISPDGWLFKYPSTWDKVGNDFIQQTASGKTINFHSEITTQEALEKWVRLEKKRKLSAKEADNDLVEESTVKNKDGRYITNYTIRSKMDGSEKLLKTTVIFDGKRRYEFYAQIPPVTLEELQMITNSLKIAEKTAKMQTQANNILNSAIRSEVSQNNIPKQKAPSINNQFLLETNNQVSEPDICGEWEWIQTTGGIAGVKKTPGTEGYSLRLIFTKNGDFKYLKNGSIENEGTYKMLKKKTIFGERYVVCYSDNQHLEESITISKDRLYLQQNVVDGFASSYFRVKQNGNL